MARRVIYIKNPKSGSHFRTLNGSGKKGGGSGGGGGGNGGGGGFPPPPPGGGGNGGGGTGGGGTGGGGTGGGGTGTGTGTGGGPITPGAEDNGIGLFNDIGSITDGTASWNDYQQSWNNWNPPPLWDFFFGGTLFDNFSLAPTPFGGTTDGISSEDYYYQVAAQNNIDAPPPAWGSWLSPGSSGGDAIRRAIWNLTHRAKKKRKRK